MTKAQLIDYANNNDIDDVNMRMTKANIIETIEASL